MLFLSHSDHASNGVKAAELALGEPVSPLLPPESVIGPSFLPIERLLYCKSYYLILEHYKFSAGFGGSTAEHPEGDAECRSILSITVLR
jgi:hypothetical protein